MKTIIFIIVSLIFGLNLVFFGGLIINNVVRPIELYSNAGVSTDKEVTFLSIFMVFFILYAWFLYFIALIESDLRSIEKMHDEYVEQIH